ncbi:hypothetical protein BH18ACI3_BH18ACI3_10920 [soil metagenome]
MMNDFKIYLVVFLLLSSTILSVGQDGNEEPMLYHSIEEPNCEVLLATLDVFAAEIFLESTANQGYVIIRGGQNPIENKFYEGFVKSYPKTRKIDESRYFVITSPSKSKLKIEFWVSKSGKAPPISSVNFDLKLPKSDKPFFVADDSVEIVRHEGEWLYIGECAACCIRTVNSFLLRDFLDANPNVRAHYIVYGNTGKASENLSYIISKEAVDDFKIARNRLRIVFGGKSQWSNAPGYLSKLADLEIWLVLKGVKPPKPTKKS